MRFILGPLIIVLGVVLMKYAVAIADFTGSVDFAEKYLTGGLAGTYSLYKIIGLILCVLGLAYTFGLFNFIPNTQDLSAPVQESFLHLKNLI